MLSYQMAKSSRGFTLIEISIVLVIIGLIIGGIMVGRSMIRSSEIKSIFTDLERFEAARMTFRSKYNCLPGDCSSAVSIGLGNNGDGNGCVNHVSAGNEVWLFWTHLGSAELLSGDYTGVNGPGAGSADSVIELNVPSSKISGVGYSMASIAPTHSSFSPIYDALGLPRPITDTWYIIGRDNTSTNSYTYGGFISPVEAKAFDVKYDDGLANNGKIRTNLGAAAYNTSGCTSGGVTTYTYANSSSALCNLQYWFHNF